MSQKRDQTGNYKYCLQDSKRLNKGTSLVVQWLRIHLAMQGHGFDPWVGNQDPT